jgi:SET domain-containing protein
MPSVRNTFRPGNFPLKVAKSKTGKGVFAISDIPKGACIIEYKGRPVTEKEQYENRGKYLFWTSDTTMIDGNIPGNTARFINHACDPNCEIDIHKRRIYIFAKKPIRAGEELNYDYDTEYFDQHIRPIGCKCTSCLKAEGSSVSKR